MLVRARAKAASSGAKVEFMEADALALPFGDGSFDLVSCAFGFRNLANYERGLFGNLSSSLNPEGQPQFWNLRASRKYFRTSVSFLFSERTSAPGRVDFRQRRGVRVSPQVCRKVPCTRRFFKCNLSVRDLSMWIRAMDGGNSNAA